MKKKAQMEIMGLAIIVILISLGLLFAVRFIAFKQPETYKKDYVHSQMAANMLNTMLHTNTDCSDVSVTELLQDAARGVHNIDCDCGGGISCDSKEFVNETIKDLLEDSLKEWKKAYYFEAKIPEDPSFTPIEVTEGNCGPTSPSVERERKQNFIPTDNGVMTVTLDICS